jgi:hypothetical protein
VSEKQFDLMNIFEGYVRNYRRMNLHQATNTSMFTKREIDYFANIGEMLGYFSFIEDSKPNLDYGRSRPMDLSWWKFDVEEDKERFSQLILHLERESNCLKSFETIDKLFCKTEEKYKPINVIGIQNVESAEKIEALNKMICDRNKLQNSYTLMVYRFHDKDIDIDRIKAFYIEKDSIIYSKSAISDTDKTGYWIMCFDEEYEDE